MLADRFQRYPSLHVSESKKKRVAEESFEFTSARRQSQRDLIH